ncbi:DUF2599 domain-containing protein [Phytoactinopolyspora limicola]|uniref:DUF2599 domain-containing protein n=1 Tax=Phytoactinopolyspora limicola TaxID=2715536 RepID=UPI001A9C8B18|nr:DUF2599 domain-containing protein [Phytoactinopolyspora limicola]
MPKHRRTARRVAAILAGPVLVLISVVLTSSVVAQAAQGPAARPGSTGPDHAAHVSVVPHAGLSSGHPDTSTGSEYIERTEWIPDPQGRRLAIYPTSYARYDAPASRWPDAWAEVIELEPDADRPHMRDQFRCHVEFARISEPDKPSWNLELWRPDVGYFATVLARCNP